MCGRYTIFDDGDIPELMAILDAANSLGIPYSTGEIFPTANVPIMKQTGDNSISVDIMKWGYGGVLKGNRPLINARSETVAERLTFREDFAGRRCVIPSTGFFEWRHSGNKEKFLFTRNDSKLLCMAGFFRPDNSFVILTSTANESVSPYHSRMPVILDKTEVRRYICDRDFAYEKLEMPLPLLLATQIAE